VRTGPQFQLTGEAFGPRLQPYVEFEAVRYPDAATSDYDAVFVGLAYQNAHSAAWTSFADASIGWGELDATGADIDFHDVSLGVTYRPSREAFYRLTLSMGSEDTATRNEDEHRGAPRLRPRLRRASWRLRGPTGAPGPSRRSTGATSPTPAWQTTRP
jgi:hypothetical protein